MPLRNGGFVFYVDVWAFFNRSAVGLFELRNISQLVRRRTMCVSTSVVILKQHRTIPALRLKHRSGSCGTASALPKCSIMSGCGTRIVLRGQKPLALCDRCPCFGSLFPPLAVLTFAASSIICAFGLAAAAPRSPYRHLELCSIALGIHKGFLRLLALNPACVCEISVIFFVFRHTPKCSAMLWLKKFRRCPRAAKQEIPYV